MNFLRRRVGIPVPRVIAWNSRASTQEIQAEFILMEKASGRSLRDVMDESPLHPPEKAQLVRELTKLQKKNISRQIRGLWRRLFFTRHQRLSQFLAPDINPHSVDSEFYLGPMPRCGFCLAESTSMTAGRGSHKQTIYDLPFSLTIHARSGK